MRPKVLVVDDEPDILDCLRTLLTAEGFDVVSASDSDEFRKLALQEKYALLILDIMLNDVNSVLLYDQLLACGFDRKVPVIFLSALAGPKTNNPVKPGHHYAMHPKPFDYEILVKDIRSLIQNAA